MIKTIAIHGMFGLKEFKVDLSDLSVLVGPNNGGKTSVLRTLKFLSDTFWQWTISTPQNNEIPLVVPARRVGLSDASYLFYGHNAASHSDARLEVGFEIDGLDGTLVVQVGSNTPSGGHFGGIFQGNFGGHPIPNLRETAPNLFAKMRHRFAADMISPVTGIPSEQSMSWPAIQTSTDNGQFGMTWRNRLHWAAEKHSEQYDRVVARIRHSLPDITLKMPRRTQDPQPRVDVSFDEPQGLHDIEASGNGLRTLINVAAAVELSDAHLLLFDEPDSHLHPALQRDIARFLTDQACPTKQIVVATHAPDFIEEVPLESLVWIDRHETSGKRCDDVGRVLVGLGAITKSHAVQFLGSDVLLYFEGKHDRSVLKSLLKRCGHGDLVNRCRTEILGGHGDCSNLPTALRLLKSLYQMKLAVGVIRDADYLELTPTGSTQHHDGVLELRLPCKELENLAIMSPETVSAAVHAAARSRAARVSTEVTEPSLADIRAKIDEVTQHPQILTQIHDQWIFQWFQRNGVSDASKVTEAENAFNKHWNDAQWRRQCCPGKDVLKRIRRWLQDEYKLTITTDGLFSVYEPDDNVKALFHKLAGHIDKATAS